MRMIPFDAFDRRILRALQDDARLSNVALAGIALLSPSQCARRVARLEAEGAIQGYRALVDPRALGLGIIGIVTVTLDKRIKQNIADFHRAATARPEIVECLSLTGEGDYQLRIAVPDLQAFSRFLMETLLPMPGVVSTRSSIILDQVKRMASLPVPEE
jgi:Lrp/AsnC family transcriptional regulator, leucine-responsive regulatory protein